MVEHVQRRLDASARLAEVELADRDVGQLGRVTRELLADLGQRAGEEHVLHQAAQVVVDVDAEGT